MKKQQHCSRSAFSCSWNASASGRRQPTTNATVSVEPCAEADSRKSAQASTAAADPAVTPNSNASSATHGKNIADPTACESFERRATAKVAANPTTETATTARRSAKNRLANPRRRLISIQQLPARAAPT